MPATVSAEKIRAIEFQGGRCHLVSDPTQIYAESQRLAAAGGGHYMDQFTYAERATDWRSNNNIAESIFAQMAQEPHPVPAWIVCSAGTGGTLATIGRYVRYCRHATRVCGADAERSVFFDSYVSGDRSLTIEQGSRIEGIGRPRVEASFLPGVIDAMVKLPDVWSLAAMRVLGQRLGRPVGPSTGTNLLAVLACAREMQLRAQCGSIVTLLCDAGSRYQHTVQDPAWLAAQGLCCDGQAGELAALLDGGAWPERLLLAWQTAGLNLTSPST
jgi:cysteine synthase